MNRKDIERRVADGFNNVTPQIYDTIRRDVANLNVDRTVRRKPSSGSIFWKIASGLLSLVLIVVAIVGIVGKVNYNAQASTVSLDVNPSVEIVLNRNNRVVKVNALNADGEIVISDMDFNGCQLKVAVNALIGSMLRAGYLSDMANSVLVSVDSDKNNYQTIAELVANEITLTLKQGQIEASVVSQWIQNDDDISAIAKEYGISVGKAQLVNKIVSKTDYTVEQLVGLSVNELSLLLPNIDIDDNDVEQSGTASDKRYINQNVALQTALQASKIEDLDVETQGLKVYKNKLDFDDGEMVYKVEYVYDKYEYAVEVGAISGEIVAFQKSLISYYVPDTELVFISTINDAKVYAMMLANVGFDVVENMFAEQMWYFRGTVYEVCFKASEMFYQYCIGSDGTVIEEYYEMINLSVEDSYLRREEVVSWFVNNNTDGFTRLDSLDGRMRVISEKTVDGRLVYELSFVSNGNKYVYKIDAVNKTFISREVSEYNDSVSNPPIKPDDKFDHGFSDWYWDNWEWDDFDDDHYESPYGHPHDRYHG